MRCWWETRSLKRRCELLAFRVMIWISCKQLGRSSEDWELLGEAILTDIPHRFEVKLRTNESVEIIEKTYTKLLSDARLSCDWWCCCCCVCCCCCCGCWETACCCCHVDTLVGNKLPGDAKACRAVISALVSWYSERRRMTQQSQQEPSC